MGERVLESCATKIKPYLVQAVKTLDITLDDYSKVVATICQDADDNVEQNEVLVSTENAVLFPIVSRLRNKNEFFVCEGMHYLNAFLLTISFLTIFGDSDLFLTILFKLAFSNVVLIFFFHSHFVLIIYLSSMFLALDVIVACGYMMHALI